MIIFDQQTRRLFPYNDEPQFFNEEIVQSLYCKKYKAKLIFIDPTVMCRVTMKNILNVSWNQLDSIINTSIKKPIRIIDLGSDIVPLNDTIKHKDKT